MAGSLDFRSRGVWNCCVVLIFQYLSMLDMEPAVRRTLIKKGKASLELVVVSCATLRYYPCMAICPLTSDGFKPSNFVSCLPCCLNHKLGSRQIELVPGVILCHRHRRIQDIDECDMTHPSITSESHTQGEEQKACVSASLGRNYMDSSINDGYMVWIRF